jgi:hypothetical protein
MLLKTLRAEDKAGFHASELHDKHFLRKHGRDACYGQAETR